jgi:mono/diheme cytochrome c family protein
VFTFVDPTLPAGYAPFGIQALNTGAAGATQIYVTYAQQNGTDNHDQTNGAGLGLVDIFDTNGVFVSHFVGTGGVLNAPWGVALAPADFGTLSNAVLIGNFGDGKINGFATGTGAAAGAVTDSTGAAFANAGLWGIAFGNDAGNQPHNTLFFSAGVNEQANGEFGRIDAGGAPTLNASPRVTLTEPTGTVSGIVNVSATVQSNVAIAKVEFFAAGVALGAVTTAPYTTIWDTRTVIDGNVAINAKATDVDGNIGVVGGEVVVSNGPAPATLAQIQAAVFTPICSGCHNGSVAPGGPLPGSQNLTAGNSFGALVNVASLEQPTLRRVKPSDADNSYLIQKLEGTAGISGSRMPLGGPFLSQATIDQIKSWIASGAANN